MIPEVIDKGMLDFGRLYKYNQIWKFWGKITFPADGSENNKPHQELHDDGAQKMCGSTMGVSDQAFFLYERPRNQQRLQTSAFSHRRNQDGRAEKYNLRWKEIHFWIFAFSKCNRCLIGAAFGWWFGNRPSCRSHVCPRLERLLSNPRSFYVQRLDIQGHGMTTFQDASWVNRQKTEIKYFKNEKNTIDSQREMCMPRAGRPSWQNCDSCTGIKDP